MHFNSVVVPRYIKIDVNLRYNYNVIIMILWMIVFGHILVYMTLRYSIPYHCNLGADHLISGGYEKLFLFNSQLKRAFCLLVKVNNCLLRSPNTE